MTHFVDESSIKEADLLIAALKNEGVKYIFGVPGQENVDVVESMRNSKIKLVQTRHERTAAFAAATYGWLTGRTGVCIAASTYAAIRYDHRANMHSGIRSTAMFLNIFSHSVPLIEKAGRSVN